MKKLHPLLTVLFLTFWGCEGILNSYDELFGSTVNLWGEEYSVKNTIVLNLSSNQLTGSIPHSYSFWTPIFGSKFGSKWKKE